MNENIQFHLRVGDDGVLNFQVNLGTTTASKDVVVTVEPLPVSEKISPNGPALPWREFVDRTYGSCADLGLERPEQGSFETREPIA